MTGLSIPWRGARHSSTWPAVTCIRYISYRAAMVISHFIQHGGRRQESWEVLWTAEIVEHIRAVMPHRIIQNPPHPSLAPIQLYYLPLRSCNVLFALVYIATTNTAPM